jgi:hypothetical protein
MIDYDLSLLQIDHCERSVFAPAVGYSTIARQPYPLNFLDIL